VMLGGWQHGIAKGVLEMGSADGRVKKETEGIRLKLFHPYQHVCCMQN